MKALIIIALAAVSFGASAAHIESTALTCQEIRSAIQRNGFQVVQTDGQPAGNKAAYATISYSSSDCTGDSRPDTAWVRSSSGKLCPAGYVCVKHDFYGTATNLNYQSWL
jgi:hypothetical protein